MARPVKPRTRRRPERELRDPWPILWRGLAGGLLGGALLGVLVVVPGVVQAQGPREPDVGRDEPWGWALVTVPVGALVGLAAALFAVIAYQGFESRSLRAARVAGALAAALTVVAVAAAFQLLLSGLTLVGALVAFALAFAATPVVTTRRTRTRAA